MLYDFHTWPIKNESCCCCKVCLWISCPGGSQLPCLRSPNCLWRSSKVRTWGILPTMAYLLVRWVNNLGSRSPAPVNLEMTVTRPVSWLYDGSWGRWAQLSLSRIPDPQKLRIINTVLGGMFWSKTKCSSQSHPSEHVSPGDSPSERPTTCSDTGCSRRSCTAVLCQGSNMCGWGALSETTDPSHVWRCLSFTCGWW